MLLEKTKFKEGDIISMKLISGEEVIAKYVSEDMTDLVVHNPIMLAMTPKGPAMTPMMVTLDTDKDYSLSKSSIILKGLTVKEIADQFTFQTTGIQPVSAGSIIR
jgi:hypothetical protein